MWNKAIDTKRPSQVCLLPHLWHVAGTRETRHCFHGGISYGPVEGTDAAELSNVSFLLLIGYMEAQHTEDPSLLSPLPFPDSLCDDPEVFQQRKACKAEDHLSALGRACFLGLRAAFLPAGSALVDWLISNSFAVSRFEAVTLASMLMEENFTKPVGARSTGATRYSDLSEQFLDDSTALYMFVSDGLPSGSSSALCHVLDLRQR